MPAKTRSKKATTATKSATQKKTVSASAKPTEVSKTAKKVEPAQKDTTTKTAAKKTTAKKVTPAKKTTAKKTAATKKVEKPAETKTTAAKVETKPAATKTTAAKAEAKPAVTTTAKAETKTTTAKVEAKPAAKTTAKKATTKKTVAKKATTAKKSPAKRATAAKAANKKVAAKKATTKKTAKKPAINTEKIEQYKSFAMDTCFEMARAMGVNMDYDNYASLLLDNADIDALTKKVLDDFHVDTKAFTFEKDGYDADLIHVIFERVADTVDIKASDFEQIGKDVKAHAAYTIKDDATANNEEYQKEFDIVRLRPLRFSISTVSTNSWASMPVSACAWISSSPCCVWTGAYRSTTPMHLPDSAGSTISSGRIRRSISGWVIRFDADMGVWAGADGVPDFHCGGRGCVWSRCRARMIRLHGVRVGRGRIC